MLKKILLQLVLFLAPKWAILPGLIAKRYRLQMATSDRYKMYVSFVIALLIQEFCSTTDLSSYETSEVFMS